MFGYVSLRFREVSVMFIVYYLFLHINARGRRIKSVFLQMKVLYSPLYHFSQFVSACISVKKEETMVWFQMK